MKKTMVGFDIGNSTIKIAMWKKQQLVFHKVPLPENLVVDGVIKLPRLMVDFLKDLKKQYGIKSGPCGLIVSDSLVVCRSFSVPAMTESQLKINLPFEFNDYITDEPDNYVYDYAVQEIVRDESEEVKELNLLGALISKAAVEEYINIFKSAGFSLRVLVPKEMAVINILRKAIADGRAEEGKEYCIIDFGYNNTNIYIFKGSQLAVIHNVPMGGADIDKVIAEHEHIDIFKAATYKESNYNEVLDKQYCRDVFTKWTVEIMKVINFYNFRNRESSLDNLFFVGGTSNIEALCQNIVETTALQSHPITELLTGDVSEEDAANGLLSIGVMLQ